MEEKIKEVMGLVDAYAHHERMQDAEASAQCREFVESKLRELLESQPNLNCKSVQKRLAEQWGFVAP